MPENHDLRRQIEILNPLGEEYSVMRTQLAASMLPVVALNCNRKNKNFRLFEIGKTYLPHSLPPIDLPEEHDVLCMAFCGADETFYGLKAAVSEIFRRFDIAAEQIGYGTLPYYHPGISSVYAVNGAVVCHMGKLHPSVAKTYDIADDVYLCEMDLSSFIQNPIRPVKFSALPKYQAVDRDLAVIVREDVPVGNLIRTAQKASALCTHAELFDIYRGEQIRSGHKSVALSFRLSAPDKTLNDDDITLAMQQILSALQTEYDAKLR